MEFMIKHLKKRTVQECIHISFLYYSNNVAIKNKIFMTKNKKKNLINVLKIIFFIIKRLLIPKTSSFTKELFDPDNSFELWALPFFFW